MSRRLRIAATLTIAAMTLAAAASVATVPSGATPATGEAAVGVVVTHGRTEAQIRSALATATYAHHGFSASYSPTFGTAPSYVSPYAPGKVSAGRRNDALRALKAVRFLGGVPTDVSFTSGNSSLAQHCSVLLAATNQFAHSGLTKPADMSNSFFAKAADGCAKSNLYSGLSNLSNAVLGWAADPGANNLGLAGHRGWEIRTAGTTYGIGYGTYSGRNISALHVLDNAAFTSDELATDYVAWPNSGVFPPGVPLGRQFIQLGPPVVGLPRQRVPGSGPVDGHRGAGARRRRAEVAVHTDHATAERHDGQRRQLPQREPGPALRNGAVDPVQAIAGRARHDPGR